ADRQNELPDQLCKGLLGLVVVDGRKVRLHLADEDRVWLNAAVLELPLVEGKRPERSVDDDAACPLARVLGAHLFEGVAAAVAESALAAPQLPDTASLRLRRPGKLLDGLAVAHEAYRRLLRLREPLEVGHEPHLVERGSNGLGVVAVHLGR